MNKAQLNIHNEILSQLQMIKHLRLDWSKKGFCYVALAFEYFNMNQNELGINLLVQIPESYFKFQFRNDLENPEFLEVTLLLLELLAKLPETQHLNLEGFVQRLQGNYYNA